MKSYLKKKKFPQPTFLSKFILISNTHPQRRFQKLKANDLSLSDICSDLKIARLDFPLQSRDFQESSSATAGWEEPRFTQERRCPGVPAGGAGAVPVVQQHRGGSVSIRPRPPGRPQRELQSLFPLPSLSSPNQSKERTPPVRPARGFAVRSHPRYPSGCQLPHLPLPPPPHHSPKGKKSRSHSLKYIMQ